MRCCLQSGDHAWKVSIFDLRSVVSTEDSNANEDEGHSSRRMDAAAVVAAVSASDHAAFRRKRVQLLRTLGPEFIHSALDAFAAAVRFNSVASAMRIIQVSSVAGNFIKIAMHAQMSHQHLFYMLPSIVD